MSPEFAKKHPAPSTNGVTLANCREQNLPGRRITANSWKKTRESPGRKYLNVEQGLTPKQVNPMGKKNRQLMAHVPDDVHQKISLLAEQAGENNSEYVRKLIIDHLRVKKEEYKRMREIFDS